MSFNECWPVIQGCVVDTGDGNPATYAFLADQLHAAGITTSTARVDISPIPASLWHQRMTTKHSKYNSNLRSSPLAVGMGYLMAAEAAINSLGDKPRTLLQVQEMPLQLLADMPNLARALYDQIFLYVPDVEPKENAKRIMAALRGILIPLVWNVQTYNLLIAQGYEPILMKFAITPLNQEQIAINQKTKGYNSSVLKHAGSGVNEKLRNAALTLVGHGQTFTEITPSHVVWQSSHGVRRVYKRPNLLTLYKDIAGANHIITYPSEMIGVLTDLISKGWIGRVTILSPRGSHEWTNLKFFHSLGYPYDFVDSRGNITQYHGKRDLDRAKADAQPRAFAQLGTISIAEAMGY